MGELGVPELLIILAVVIVIFGPGKLADLGRALGSGIKDFRRAVRSDEPTIVAQTEPELRAIGLGADDERPS